MTSLTLGEVHDAEVDPHWNAPLQAALESIRSPGFLKTPHGAPVLRADFGQGEELEVSFSIALSDGTSLADPRNSALRSDIYDLICLQALKKGSRSASPAMVKRNVIACIYFVDYLLLNHNAKLTKYGFPSITGPNLIQLIRTIARSKQTVEELYDWRRRLSRFLIEGGDALSAKVYQAAVEKEPTIESIPPADEARCLALTEEQLCRARAFLFINKLYNKQRRDGLLIPNSSALSSILYKNTLINSVFRQIRLHFPELVLGINEPRIRELPGVPCRTAMDDRRACLSTIAQYKRLLKTLRRLEPFDLGVSKEALDEALRYDVSETIELKVSGHTNPLPTPHVLFGLRSAIDLIYTHGRHVLASHANVLIAAQLSDDNVNLYVSETGIGHLLHPDSLAWGIHRWSLLERRHRFGPVARPNDLAKKLRETRGGLLEITKVILGAMLYVTGIMVAGRQSEISEILSCSIDDAKRWISLSTRKSGFGNVRKSHWRPIPRIVAEILEMLCDYKERLIAHGVQVPKELFALPSSWGNFSTFGYSLCTALDLFADFIEMPTDEFGRRFYVRQHQLRQFFILAFFYAGGVNGFETLRWFVRHYDPAHLWAYLRQNVPGDVMMRYKAVAANGMIRSGAEEVADLALFLRSRLGVERFEVMTDAELVAYLEDLQDIGDVEIEPLFFTTSGEKRWKLGVSIFGEL